jgi:hypothetical protein
MDDRLVGRGVLLLFNMLRRLSKRFEDELSSIFCVLHSLILTSFVY